MRNGELKHTVPTTVELYAHTNGMLIIREPDIKMPGGYKIHEMGTSIEKKGRKAFAAFLKRRGISGIDAATVPLASGVGPIETNGRSIAVAIREKRGLTRTTRTVAERKPRDPYTPRAAVNKVSTGELRELLEMLAANFAAAAIVMRKIDEYLEQNP